MIGCRTTLGLSLLTALLFCGFAAQSASASLKVSNNTTMFTCNALGGSLDFADDHCNEKVSEGLWGHTLIPLNTTTDIKPSNEKVTESTKKSEPAVLKGTVALVKVTIECTTVENNALGESFIHNAEPEAKKHSLSGVAKVIYRNCTAKPPEKCTVAEPIAAEATVEAVEGLEGPKGEKNAMGLQFIGKGSEETFAAIEFKGESCALKNLSVKVKGRVIGTSGPSTESGQENKASGSTIVFTPKFSMQELKVGNQLAEFTSIITPKFSNPTTATTIT
jgi:hypothetical protein